MNRLFTGRIDHDDSCGGEFNVYYSSDNNMVIFKHSGKLLYTTKHYSTGLHSRLGITDYSEVSTDSFTSHLWIS